MSDLEIICEQRDPGGDVCRIEYDPRDGRMYLTIVANGHEAPFELTLETARPIADTLRAFAGPVDLSRLRFTGPNGEAVQHAPEAVKQAITGNGR